MKQIIKSLSIAALCIGSINLAQAQSSSGQKSQPSNSSDSSAQPKRGMTGSSTDGHIQAMMAECMRVNRNADMCNQQMQKCRQNMSAPECEKIHDSMKKSK
jgi:hypothetical protein